MLAVILTVALLLGARLPGAFLPVEDQGYAYVVAQLPYAASLERTDAVCKKIEDILKNTPGVKYYTTVEGFSLLSQVQATYNAFFFVTLKPWSERKNPTNKSRHPRAPQQRTGQTARGDGAAFSPPSIPGVGTSGGFTFMLEDRSGNRTRPFSRKIWTSSWPPRGNARIAGLLTTYLPSVPQVFVKVDRDKVLKLGVPLGDVYSTLQTFMGGNFVNYFNRFGRQWQVYLEAEDQYRARAENLLQFYVRNNQGQAVAALGVHGNPASHRPGIRHALQRIYVRANQRRGRARLQRRPGHQGARGGFRANDAAGHRPRLFRHVVSGTAGGAGRFARAHFQLSVLCVFLILAAQFESWSLPISVLLGTPTAILGAFLALTLRGFQNNVYVQIGLIMLIGLAAKNAILIVPSPKRNTKRANPFPRRRCLTARIRLRPILMTSFALSSAAFRSGSRPVPAAFRAKPSARSSSAACWARRSWTSLLCRSLFPSSKKQEQALAAQARAQFFPHGELRGAGRAWTKCVGRSPSPTGVGGTFLRPI
jgi:HAE1 family hydrophobic/amphiphilic exporter-1